MPKKLLTGYLILCMLQGTCLYSQTRYDNYVKLSVRNFNLENFDSCLHYNYILAYWYTSDKDTIATVNTWYAIAIINLLQEKYSQAQAAQIIAHNFITDRHPINASLEAIYNSILKFNNPDSKSLLDIKGLQNLKGRTSIPLGKLFYIRSLIEVEYDYRNHHLKEAKSTLQKLLYDMIVNCDKNWFGYAKANMLMGNCCYTKEDFLQSTLYYDAAIRTYEDKRIFNSDCANSYRGYLNALWFTGQSEKRDSCFYELEISNFLSKNRAGYYFIKGDFLRFTSYTEALEAYLQAYYSKGIDRATNYELKKQIIYVYVMIDQYAKAIGWFKELDTKSIGCFDYIIIAYSYFKLGDIDRSNTYIQKALKSPELNNNQNIILYWLAKYYFEIKKYSTAEAYYKLFLHNMLETKSNSIQKSLSYGSLGYFYWYGKSNYQRSLEYYHKAVFAIVNKQAPSDIYQMPDINKSLDDKVFARELYNKAEALYEISNLQKIKIEKIHDLKSCLAHLELSFTVAHRYKMSLNNDEQRFEYADNIKPRFPYIICVCNSIYHETGELFYAKKAFEYAEKGRASLLLSTMRGVNAYKMQLLPENLKKMENQIWGKAEILSGYLSEANKAPELNHVKIDQYNFLLTKLRHQEDSLVQIFKTKYPAYYNVRYNADVTGVDLLQKTLGPNEAVLEYSLSREKLVIYMLTRSEFKIFTDTLGNGFYSNVEKYRQILSNYSVDYYSNSAIRAYVSVSNQLYNQLVRPIEPFLSGKKLIIIPDDVLTQVPFETLVTEPLSKNSPASYRSLPYLIKKHNITYNYSGTLYAMNNKPLFYHNTKILGVAPYYDKLKLEKLIAKDLPNSLRKSVNVLPIPGIYDEVRGIHRLFGGKVLMKGSATKENFQKIADQYEILHLATHGVVNNDYPMYSNLMFTLGKDSVNDGLLKAWEIYNMQLNTSLVVLSACNTGYGKLHRGEGMISLSRGFFIAGAKSVITTLWPVPDGNSSRLMNYFYTNLSAKENIADALYHAKLTYLRESDDMDAYPSLWAGYIVLGNGSIAFEPSHSKSKYFYYIGLCLLISMIIIIIFRKKIRVTRENKLISF